MKKMIASLVAVVGLSVVPTVAFAGTESQTKVYEAKSFDKVWDAAKGTCEDLKLKISEEKKEDGLLVAKTRVSLTTWGGALNLNITETKEGVKVTAAASTSQAFDSKKNKKDLEKFFETLDKKVD